MTEPLKIIDGYHKRAAFGDEAAVKRVVRRILNHYKIFNFMPPANAYGKSGVSDVLAIGNGRTVAIECKYDYNKPTPMQLEFGENVERAGGLFLVVNEKNMVEEMMRCIIFLQFGEDPPQP